MKSREARRGWPRCIEGGREEGRGRGEGAVPGMGGVVLGKGEAVLGHCYLLEENMERVSTQ